MSVESDLKKDGIIITNKLDTLKNKFDCKKCCCKNM